MYIGWTDYTTTYSYYSIDHGTVAPKPVEKYFLVKEIQALHTEDVIKGLEQKYGELPMGIKINADARGAFIEVFNDKHRQWMEDKGISKHTGHCHQIDDSLIIGEIESTTSVEI
jgi:hypothetical protein